MLFKTDTTPNADHMADWPKHYYEIEDINMREACLKKYIEEHPDSSADKRRLEIFERRYGKKAKKDRGDEFIKSYMMILIAYTNNLHSFDALRKEKELSSDLKKLCVLDFEQDELLFEEWKNFAEVYLSTCASHSYRSTLFGFLTLKDDVVAMKIAKEIDTVTRLSPRQFNLENECLKLREIMINVYISKIRDGETYWNDYLRSAD
ncbi:MAG: hypothetical protein K5770_01565 [Lachnospiraceae bacterium]|nr:hypothetical protein [Lachnospiraceae bacterium]